VIEWLARQDPDWVAALAQVAAVAFAMVAIWVTVRTAKRDRRRADARAERDRAEALADERRRWEQSLLLRLAIALEAPGDSGTDVGKMRSGEMRAILYALGPTLLPATCDWVTGETPASQEAAIAVPETMIPEYGNRAKAEVAHALRYGLRRSPGP
jgi:hypothetical protein